jgi:hypothetical protein
MTIQPTILVELLLVPLVEGIFYNPRLSGTIWVCGTFGSKSHALQHHAMRKLGPFSHGVFTLDQLHQSVLTVSSEGWRSV